MRGLLALAVVGLLSAGLFLRDQPGFSASWESALSASLAEIRPGDVAAHLAFLASDQLEGRAPSTRGGTLAAEYLAAQLELLGYEPASSTGYFQHVPVVESVTDPGFVLRVGDNLTLAFGTQVVAQSGRLESTVDIDGEVVFVGHGIVAPEYRWDDYAGVDVSGKIVLVMVNEPAPTASEPALFAGDALTYYGRWTYKFEEAARHGASGVLLIHTTPSATYPWEVVRASFGGSQFALPPDGSTPGLALKGWVTEEAARALVGAAGRELDALRRTATSRGASAVPLGVRAVATLRQRVTRTTSPNVIGVLRGTTPGEGVLFTAHYDHLGVAPADEATSPGRDRIYNGAVDNASGVAGTLEIAQALARARTRSRRSIYVMFTTAEESGLLGSQHFAAHPLLPPAAWAGVVNIDELNVFGPSRDLALLGVERSSIRETADALAARRGRVIALDPEPSQGNFFRSDHFPLAKIGVPAVSLSFPTQFVGPSADTARRLHSRFNDLDYHQPGDQVRDDWNYDGAVADLRLLAELGWHLANEPAMPAYHADEAFARPRQGRTGNRTTDR